MLLRLLPAALALAGARALDFYVDPAGSDATGTGAASSPWASPFPALAAIAAAKSPGGALPGDVTVHLASGSYYLPRPLAIGAASGGDGVSTVTFSGPADPAAPPAVLSGGALVPAAAWAPVAGAAGVYSAPLPAGLAMARQLFDAATGLRAPLARSAIGLARSAGQWGVAYPPGMLAPADLPALAEAELVIWHNWVSSQNKIAAVNLTNSSIHVAGEAGDPFFGAGGNIRFALQNVASAAGLAAGSFYVAQGALVLRTAGGAPPGAMVVEAVPEVVQLTGSAGAPVQGVRLANLTLAHAAADLEGSCMAQGCGGQSCSESTTAAFHARSALGCSLEGVEVVGAGGYGVWWDAGCAHCAITGSWLHDLGMGGVRVGNTENTGDPATETTRNTTVSDCEIADGGKVVPAGTGVLSQEAFGSSIVHNHIHHLFYTGVSTGWTWGYAADSDAGQTVGWNHIHDIFQRELSDGGCVYNLGRSPGTRIINNVCHDVESYGYGGWGLYTDEGSSNVTLRDNVVYRTKDAGFHQHYGTDNLITNNIFAFPSTLPCEDIDNQCDHSAIRSSQHMDCGLWAEDNTLGVDYGCNSSFTFEGNIVLLGAESGNATRNLHTTFCVEDHKEVNGLRNMTWGSNVYYSLPLASQSLDDLVFSISFEHLNFSQWQAEYKDETSVVADPLFADAANLNFTLLPGSPALALGFTPIDTSTVGPRAPFRRAQH